MRTGSSDQPFEDKPADSYDVEIPQGVIEDSPVQRTHFTEKNRELSTEGTDNGRFENLQIGFYYRNTETDWRRDSAKEDMESAQYPYRRRKSL